MHEISNFFMIAWTIAVGILWTGISWATVKVTLKISQRDFEKRLDELSKGWKLMEHRVTEDEKSYMTKADCDHEQAECGKHRDYHESQLIQKLDEIKKEQSEIRSDVRQYQLQISAAMARWDTLTGWKT